MFYIPFSVRAKLGCQVTAGNAFNFFKQFCQAGLCTTGYIINLINGSLILSCKCQYIGLHRIGYKGKIAAMLSIAIDKRWLIIQYGFYKKRYHCCIRALWILFRTEYIKIAEPDQLQSI